MFQNTFQGPGTAALSTYTFEILIMWLVSGLIGLLIGYIIWRLRPRTFVALQMKIKGLTARLGELEADNSRFQQDNSKLKDMVADWKIRYEASQAELNDKIIRLEEREAALAAFAAATDDLTAIPGIDARIVELLFNAGICTFQDMANTSTEVLKNILKEAGRGYLTHSPDAWKKRAYQLYTSRKEHYAGFAGVKIGRRQLEALGLK